jgi:AraC-like DNA-binding protein
MFFSLIDLLRNWGVTAEQLLGPLGLTERDVVEPSRRLSHDQYVAILERARALSGEPAIGFAWGLQMHVAAFGYLGFAIMTAADLRGALEVAETFFELTATAFPMRLRIEGESASLVLEERASYGSVRDVALISRLVGLWRISETISGRDLRAIVEVAIEEPSYHARFTHPGIQLRWRQPTTRILFDASMLEHPLVMANPLAHALARDQCTRELQETTSDGRIVREIRGLLHAEDGRIRSAREVAAAAHASPRTLRRKLTQAGTSLASLLEGERRERALMLLRTSDLPLEGVAERLGYANAQNFERAFRRWTGMTPSAYRRR